MPALRCEIWCTSTHCVTLKADSAQLVGELVVALRCLGGAHLPERDADDAAIPYALFRKIAGARLPLREQHMTLAQAAIRDGDTLWLADVRKPWWHAAESPAPQPMPPQGSTALHAADCSLQIAAGVSASVPRAGLELGRAYLLRHLPHAVLVREHALSLAGRRSRLHAVSRRLHCAIRHGAAGWTLQVYAPTFVEGHCYTDGMSLPLAASTTLLLGREGWPVALRLQGHP